MKDLRTAIIDAVDGTLRTLGAETRQLIYTHLKNYWQIGREDIPANLTHFNEALRDLLGREAKILLDEMFTSSLYHKLGLTLKRRVDWTFATYVDNASKQLK